MVPLRQTKKDVGGNCFASPQQTLSDETHTTICSFSLCNFPANDVKLCLLCECPCLCMWLSWELQVQPYYVSSYILHTFSRQQWLFFFIKKMLWGYLHLIYFDLMKTSKLQFNRNYLELTIMFFFFWRISNVDLCSIFLKVHLNSSFGFVFTELWPTALHSANAYLQGQKSSLSSVNVFMLKEYGWAFALLLFRTGCALFVFN